VEIITDEDYPFARPTIRFQTRIAMRGVDATGKVNSTLLLWISFLVCLLVFFYVFVANNAAGTIVCTPTM
jgi:hypothetical protein